MTMTCPEAGRLRAWLDDEAAEDEAHVLGEHLAGCAACLAMRETLDLNAAAVARALDWWPGCRARPDVPGRHARGARGRCRVPRAVPLPAPHDRDLRPEPDAPDGAVPPGAAWHGHQPASAPAGPGGERPGGREQGRLRHPPAGSGAAP